MPDEPTELQDAVAHAEAAFAGHLGRAEYEVGLDPNTHDSDVIQLRKACRLLNACRVLRNHNGYHTSVIEMSFATIEHDILRAVNGAVSSVGVSAGLRLAGGNIPVTVDGTRVCALFFGTFVRAW